MTLRPRLTTIAYSVAAALAQLAAVSAHADSAVGVDTAVGNSLNPPGRSSIPRQVEPDGIDTVRRSPSGQLYGAPTEESVDLENPAPGWKFSAGIDAGALAGSGNKQNAVFRQYKDLKNGAYLNYVEAEGRNAQAGTYVQAIGGGLGREDQFYGVQFGRYNDWRVKTFYNETIHVFTDTYKSLYGGVGSARLTLPTGVPGLAPGSGATIVTSGTYAVNLTNAQINALTAPQASYAYTGSVMTYSGYVGSNNTITTATQACTPALPCFAYNNVLYANNAAALGINGNAGNLIPGYRVGTANPVVPAATMPATTTALYNGASAAGLNLNTDMTGVSAAINGYLANVSPTELSLVRKKGGIGADLRLTDFWKAYAAYSNEKRQGARPFGMVLRATADSAVEIPESIDYTTHDLLAGLQYSDSRNAFNLRLSASLFRNNIDTLTVEQPFLQGFVGVVGQPSTLLKTATFDLYPDSDAYNLKGEYARSLPEFYQGRFTVNAALGSNRQNDKLIAPLSGLNELTSTQYAVAANGALGAPGVIPGTVNSGYALAANTNAALMFNANNWNTTAALSRQTANQRIDTRLFDLGLALTPTTALNVKGKLRYYETVNKGGYTAYNPLTGQYGYLGLDGTLNNLVVAGLPPAAGAAANVASLNPCLSPSGAAVAGCFFPGIVGTNAIGIGQGSVSNNLVYSPTRDYKQINAVLAGDYDLNRHSSLNASFERETFHRTHRERDNTWEDKLKLGYVNRGYELATLRTSYEWDRKRGGEYNYWPNAEEYPTALTGLNYETILANVYNCSGLGAGGAGYAAANPALCAAYPAFTALGGYLARYSADTRKYDQADRNQRIFNARLNFMPRPDIDLGLMLQRKDIAYPHSLYGLGADVQNSVNLDLNFQPSAERSIYVYYSYQDGRKRLNANAGTGNGAAGNCTMGTATSATVGTMVNGAYLTPANIWALCAATADPATSNLTAKFTSNDIWSSETKDRNDAIGIGVQNDFGRVKVGLDYTLARSVTRIGYTYGPGWFTTAANAQGVTAATINQVNAQLAGNGWDDMIYRQNVLNLNVIVPLTRRASVHIYDRYELARIRDWHYDSMPLGASNAGGTPTVLLDDRPQDFKANVFGLFLMYKL